MTEELKNKVEKFAADLNNSNVAFIVVVITPGDNPRWHTNLQRCTNDVIEKVRYALNDAGRAITKSSASGNGLVSPPV
jgi:hypothetical protein